MTFFRISTFMRKHEGEIEYQLINFIYALVCCNIMLLSLRGLAWLGIIAL